MIGQMQMTTDGKVLDKVEIAIKRLKAFEPPEGYWLAFSGGRDSQVVYDLCKKSGVKFEAHYSVTSVDLPELLQFIMEHYHDVIWDLPRDRNGNRISMWNLIPKKRMPPTRVVRYCCEKFKESSGKGRVTITGVRWAESSNRMANQGIITFPQKKTAKKMEGMGVNFTKTVRAGVVLNYDDDNARRSVEHCYRMDKTLLNPIIDWTDDDVWQYHKEKGLPHCCLYDEGFNRMGCIGCPMGGAKKQKREFDRWPKYRELYIRAFERMIAARKADGLPGEWETPEDVMRWWLQEE